jgi:hypothetical protein
MRCTSNGPVSGSLLYRRQSFPMPNLRPRSQPKLGEISIRGGGPVTQAQLSIWLHKSFWQALLQTLRLRTQIKLNSLNGSNQC